VQVIAFRVECGAGSRVFNASSSTLKSSFILVCKHGRLRILGS
jgi:hypothetical protein